MNKVPCPPATLKPIPTTQCNNAAVIESVPDANIPNSGGEIEETQLHEADKCSAKIHYLSRTIARKHGVIPAALLSGFAYKLKFHRKNKWRDRWWYYDPIETLRTHRWPYLSDGCICQNTKYLQEEKLLIKSCNNQASYDRTSWYAMEDSVREAALSDLIWFDVKVANTVFKTAAGEEKRLGIFGGLIYHNLRFHLRKLLKANPELVVPYHKLKKAQLARDLPLSLATVKRVIAELIEAKFIVVHPNKRSLYTLVDQSELHQNGSSVNAIVSSVNANGSSVNGSSVNAIVSTVNANGSSVNAIVSSVNDYTQYETDEKLVRNQSQKGACVSVDENPSDVRTNDSMINHVTGHNIIPGTVYSPFQKSLSPDNSNNKSANNNTNESDHKLAHNSVSSTLLGSKESTATSPRADIISNTVSSHPPEGKENTDTSPRSAFYQPKTFAQLIQENAKSLALLNSLSESQQQYIREVHYGAGPYFVEYLLPSVTIQELWDVTHRDQLVLALRQPCADYILKEIKGHSTIGLSDERLWQLLYYPVLETLVRALAENKVCPDMKGHTLPNYWNEVSDTHWALVLKLQNEAKCSAEFKGKLFKQGVLRYNHYGWELREDVLHKQAVQPTASGFKKIKAVFENNPGISTQQLINVLWECVDVSLLTEAPEGFDKHWATRQGKNLDKFAQYIEKIIGELELYSECPIGAVA